jgi:hypothetical protein
VLFQQAVKGDSRIAIDLEVFRFDVDHDEFAGLLVNIDLRPDHPARRFHSPAQRVQMYPWAWDSAQL